MNVSRCDEIRTVSESQLLAPTAEDQRGFSTDSLSVPERDRLEKALPKSGLHTQCGELRRDIVGRQLMAPGRRTPTFQEVVGEKLHVRANRFGADLLQRPFGYLRVQNACTGRNCNGRKRAPHAGKK
jgi:hypothetical protein